MQPWYQTLLMSPNCGKQDKRQYIKVPTISIWTNIMFNNFNFFNTSWCGFIIQINIILVQVLIINNALIHLLWKCRSPAICDRISHCFSSCVATLPVLSSKILILPNFANLWNIQTADFKKLLHQINILIKR